MKSNSQIFHRLPTRTVHPILLFSTLVAGGIFPSPSFAQSKLEGENRRTVAEQFAIDPGRQAELQRQRSAPRTSGPAGTPAPVAPEERLGKARLLMKSRSAPPPGATPPPVSTGLNGLDRSEENMKAFEDAKRLMSRKPDAPKLAKEKTQFLLLKAQETRMPGSRNPQAFLEDSVVLADLLKGNHRGNELYARIALWNELALYLTALDHTNPDPKDPPPDYAEQFGPTRTSRALAIMHLALYEAMIYAQPGTPSYARPSVPALPNGQSRKTIRERAAETIAATGGPIDATKVSLAAAITEASYQALIHLFPEKQNIAFELYRLSFEENPKQDETPDPEKEELKKLRIQEDQIEFDNKADFATRRSNGQKIGRTVALAVLLERRMDGAENADPTSDTYDSGDPLKWKKDPLNIQTIALGAHWGQLRPFTLPGVEYFRPWWEYPYTQVDEKGAIDVEKTKAEREKAKANKTYVISNLPPAWDNPATKEAFKVAYEEVFHLGGDPHAPAFLSDRRPTPTERKGEEFEKLDENNETFKAIFWGYDGTALLCAPPRLYNMIALSIAYGRSGGHNSELERPDSTPSTAVNDPLEFARMLCLINVAMGDAGIAAWESKYHFRYPRPTTLIREIPNDNEAGVRSDGLWTPLGAPVSNARPNARNLSPGFPAYPSGHATFGGAVFEVLRKFYARDFPFTFISDEYNGMNSAPGGRIRPEVRAEFKSMRAAEYDNGQSRIWLGIHWAFDRDGGINQGNAIGGYVFDHYFKKSEAPK